ncbi:MAG TPA: PhnD/SsuA/transferrin family substrate-binding protein [Alphaproteobacteria bacterium]|nr:PhnD/SsuA/transferrin family substrate-binding protein [Alphaproteobacteria bacterium]
MRLAALPMYDMPETASTTDALWTAVARRLRLGGMADVPDRLTRGVDPREVWGSPHLLLAQTCGYPLMHEFEGRLALVATPRYAVPGCEGAVYRSRIVSRADDPRERFADFAGSVAAINSEDSHSGFNILRWRAAREPKRPFFDRVVVTGGHVASLKAVRSGQADIAAIDCVTFALLERHRPDGIARLRIVEDTPAAPALPFVTSIAVSDEERSLLRRALTETFADPTLHQIREDLLLAGIEDLPLARYRAIRDYAEQGGSVRLA